MLVSIPLQIIYHMHPEVLHDRHLPFNLLAGFNTLTPYSMNITSWYSRYIVLQLQVHQIYLLFSIFCITGYTINI